MKRSDRVPDEIWTGFVTLYSGQGSPRKRNAKMQNGYLKKPYKELQKEEMPKTKEKRKDKSI